MSAPVPMLRRDFLYHPRRATAGGIRRRDGSSARSALALALAAAAALFFLGGTVARAQQPGDLAPLNPPAAPQERGFFLFRQPQRPVEQVIAPRQEGAKIYARFLDQANPDNTNVVVSLSRQRVYLMLNGETVIDSPISSGRKGHTTPSGSMHVMEKELNHFSNIYGNFIDRTGRVVRSGVSARIDSAPSGTHFEGAPMRFFMRLTDGGVGMHIGILPGYAASHGCVRLPADIAPLIYARVRVGTPVSVQE